MFGRIAIGRDTVHPCDKAADIRLEIGGQALQFRQRLQRGAAQIGRTQAWCEGQAIDIAHAQSAAAGEPQFAVDAVKHGVVEIDDLLRRQIAGVVQMADEEVYTAANPRALQ
jgi:hypothetical protein